MTTTEKLAALVARMDPQSANDRHLECCLLADLWREKVLEALEAQDTKAAVNAAREHDRVTQNAIRWAARLELDLARKADEEIERQKGARNRLRQLKAKREGLHVVGE